MNKYVKAEAVVRCCGDYVAWHEMSIYIDYILGDYDNFPECFEESAGDWMTDNGYFQDEKTYEWSKKITKEDKCKLDAYIVELVIEDTGDYSDYEVQTVLLEINSTGGIEGSYIAC